MQFIISIVFSFLIDILTKISATIYINKEIKIIYDIITFKLIHNKWVAFSFPLTWILLKIITALIIILITYHYYKNESKYNSKYIDTWYWLLLWWAMWNWIERIFKGEVTDFINIKYFAILNFGDIFINIWVWIIIFTYFKEKWAKKK